MAAVDANDRLAAPPSDGTITAAALGLLLRELREQDRLRIGLDREIRR